MGYYVFYSSLLVLPYSGEFWYLFLMLLFFIHGAKEEGCMQIGRDNIRFENSQDQMKGSVDKESAHTYKKKKKT